MTLDARLILAGQQPDVVNILGGAAQAAGLTNQVQQQNRLSQLYQQQGPGIMAGEQNALRSLAQIDPNQALGVQESRLGMENTRNTMRYRDENLKIAREEARVGAEDRVRTMSAEQASAERARLEEATAIAMAAESQEQLDAFLGQVMPDMVGVVTMDNREMYGARALGVIETLKGKKDNTDSVQSSEILDDGTVVAVTKDNKVTVTRADGQKVTGQDAIDAVDEARKKRAEYERIVTQGRREGTNQAEAETGAAAAAAGESGKQAVEMSGAAWEQANTLASSIGTIDEAIAAIDAGGRAGAVDRFIPSITKASASLQNAMDRMGLDIIQATTFGALSEGELRLAMETAVPRNLDEPQLREWLAAKREANQKAMDMMIDAAEFLGKPGGTLPKWIAKNRDSMPRPASPVPTADSGSGSQPIGSQTDAALDEIDALLKKYGQ